MASQDAHPPEQRRERTSEGSLIVREGLPERWHYTLAIDDNPQLHIYRGRITVMFDGVLRCHLSQSNLAKDEEAAVVGAREKVLAWIAAYEGRNGPAEPPRPGRQSAFSSGGRG